MLIKAATHLRPILRLGVIQPSQIPSTSALSPNAFTSNSSLTQLTASVAAAPRDALQSVAPQHAGSSGSGGEWNAGSGGGGGGGGFSGGYAGYGRAFVNASAGNGTGGLVGHLQRYQQDERHPGEGRIRQLKEGRPLLKVVDDVPARQRQIAATTKAEGRWTIVDVSEAMTVQSLAGLRPLDRDEDTVSIDGDEAPSVIPMREGTRHALPPVPSLWTVGIRAGVAAGRNQSVRLITTAAAAAPAPLARPRHHGKSADDSTLLTRPPTTTRRNSTSAATVRSPELTEAEQAMKHELDTRDRLAGDEITTALHRGDHAETMRLISAYRSQDGSKHGNPPYYTSRTYNAILAALHAFRQPGEPISAILVTYNEMLERDVLPTIGTYSIVIQALLERDAEVDRAVKGLSRKKRWLEWEKRVKGDTEARALARRAGILNEHEKELQQLVMEKNYESAVKLFRAAIIYNRHRPFRAATYLALLAAAARRGDVETAIAVWGHHEGVKNSKERPDQSDVRPVVRMFTLLLQAYAHAREASGIHEVLHEFMEQERKGAVVDGRGQGEDQKAVMRTVQGLFAEVVHAYVVAGSSDVALKMLDEMAEVAPSDAATPGSLPQLSANVIARCVYALSTNGDFERALQLTRDIEGKYATTLDANQRATATRQCTQYIINEAISTVNPGVLARAVELMPAADVESAKQSAEDATAIATTINRALLLVANEQPYPVDTVLRLLRAFESPEIRAACADSSVGPRTGFPALLRACFERGTPGDALFALQFFDKESNQGAGALSELVRQHRSELVALARDFKEALMITSMLARYGCYPSLADSRDLVRQYSSAEALAWTADHVSTLIKVFEGPASAVEADALRGEDAREYDLALDRLVKDLAAASPGSVVVDPLDLGRLMNILALRKGDEQARTIMLETFGQDAVSPLLAQPASPHISSEAGSETFAAPSETSTAPTSVTPTYYIDRRLSFTVDAHFGIKATSTPLASYAALKQGLAKHLVPEPAVIGRLLQALARMGEESKVRELYTLAHEVIATSVPQDRQLRAWTSVEDYMLIATCHLGHLEQAGMHRARIIEQGVAPSADAYATMISSTKDTTDDASVARELWEESQRYGVKPHLYLYNTIISKLSKARKAETALEFFNNMKAEGWRPSSVTYGAVINACVRVGDVESATTLFQEMQNMPNFKPRVPPYNTMMQMHLQTRPSRELVLHYYDQMIQAGVSPSSHTYKLLLDAYGTLEPIDLDAMQKIFDNLVKDRRVDVQGTHWASLIHAYGNVAKQPERAIEIFESIPSHPSTLSKDIEPVCWEAILNVLASAQMADRMEEYVARMQQQHVRPTAYVNNMLIRGYAAVGKLDKSREIFESMQDAVMGVAAPNNHPALLTSSGQSKPLTTAHTDVVFREPSTYEAMIRAELQAGNRTAASALCDRLEARMYPVAVTTRIRSLIDDPSSPSAGLRS